MLIELNTKLQPYDISRLIKPTKQSNPNVLASEHLYKDNFIPSEGNSFVAAFLCSFQNHLPISIKPDDIWICIQHAVGMEINKYPEEYRSKFVNHEGQKELTVRRDGFSLDGPNDWAGVFPEFKQQILENSKSRAELLLCDFSTTTTLLNNVQNICLMDIMKSYYKYSVMTMCGIPSIQLEGTLEDWELLLERTLRIQESFLEKEWMVNLSNLVMKFTQAARGYVDHKWWNSFFKENDGSGTTYINGWINHLFPYDKDGKLEDLEREIDSYPSGISKVPIIWNYHSKQINLEVSAGFNKFIFDGMIRINQAWEFKKI